MLDQINIFLVVFNNKKKRRREEEKKKKKKKKKKEKKRKKAKRISLLLTSTRARAREREREKRVTWRQRGLRRKEGSVGLPPVFLPQTPREGAFREEKKSVLERKKHKLFFFLDFSFSSAFSKFRLFKRRSARCLGRRAYVCVARVSVSPLERGDREGARERGRERSQWK